MWTLVTGGSRRLGAAICIALAEKGRPVIVHYHKSEKDAFEVVERCQAIGTKAEAIRGDFSSVSGVEEFLDRYLHLYPDTVTLINNVGQYLIAPSLKTEIQDWLSIFQSNLHTPFILSKNLVPSIIRHHGQIINIGTSGLKRQSANTYSSAYHIAKEGLWNLTLSMARELAPQGVTVNMVSPGLLDISVDTYPVPMHRTATCEEICRVICFLLEPESSYITGQNIEVAGGLGLA